MIDITNLTSLITAFRQETEQGSISPETLGSLLQAIANELKNASSAQEEADIKTLQTNLSLLKGIVNEMASNVSHLESVVSEHNSSSASNFNKIANSISDIEQYIESLDGIVSENCSNIESLNALNSRTSYLPVFRGTIVIDPSSITSAVRNYFNYSLNDGFFNLVRANQLIGRAYVYTFNGFKIVEVIGLCSINNMSFIYHDRLDHVLLRINSKNEIFVTGSLETIDLQNQINEKQAKLTAGAGVLIENNVISVDNVAIVSYIMDFTIQDGVKTGSFDAARYAELRQAISDGRNIIIKGGATRTNAISSALGDDYLVLRFSVPRIQDDNATVTWSVYELRVNETSYTSKAIHKVIGAA